jgi:hypothetical protein
MQWKMRAALLAGVCVLSSTGAVSVVGQTSGQQWYVTPNGTGSGTFSSPMSLAKALSGTSPAAPGDTIWLRGGKYVGAFSSSLAGTSTAPIVVRAYAGERVVLDGNNSAARSAGYVLTIKGAYTWYWGFEVMSSDAARTGGGSYGTFPGGITVGQSTGIKLINLVVHDVPGQGMGLWSEATNTEVYGCLVYYNGVTSSHDHGIYLQNQNGSKVLKDNIIFSQASHNIHAYASSDAYLNNISIIGNTVFEAASTTASSSRNILLGGLRVTENPVVDRNYTYFRGTQNGNSNIGYSAGTSNAKVTNNYFVAGNASAKLNVNAGAAVSGNVFIGPTDPSGLSTAYPSNTFSSSRPTSGVTVIVRPNQYEVGRANVTVYNWAKSSSVAIPLTGIGLTNGDEFEVRDAQDFFGGPVATGLYTGSPVTVPMSGLVAAAPVGAILIQPMHTAPQFGTFVVLKRPSSDDDSAPTVNLTAPSPAQVVYGTTTLSATASDDVGVASVQFRVDGENVGPADSTAPYSASWNTTTWSNASHTVTAVATDTSGNQTVSSPVTVSVKNTDTTLPTVSVTSPTSGATLSGTATLAASASDNVGVVGVQFKVNGANVGSEDTSAPYAVSWNSASVANGAHSITAVARDAAGNTRTSSQVSITVSNSSTDTTLPTVSVTSPASGATLSGTVTLAASASDNVGVAGVQFLVDGQPVGSEDRSAPYTLSFDTRTKSNGSHTIAARARDAAGNTRTATAVSVSFSNTSSTSAWKLYYEAEQVGLASPMTRKWHSSASHGQYVSSGTAEKGLVSFWVDVPSAGTYVLWARVLAPTSSNDSLYISVDGGAEDIYDVAQQTWSSSWQWSRVVGRNAGGAQIKLNLTAGSHRILFRGREVNTGLDRIMITNSTSTTP